MQASFSSKKLYSGSEDKDVDTEFVHIANPRDGGGRDVVYRPAMDADRERFASEYAEFLASQKVQPAVEAAPAAAAPKPKGRTKAK